MQEKYAKINVVFGSYHQILGSYGHFKVNPRTRIGKSEINPGKIDYEAL